MEYPWKMTNKKATFRHERRVWRIPERMWDGIERYICSGVEPGDFLAAVFANDFVQAAGRADTENLTNLPAYLNFLCNHAPLPCWGSAEKMDLWRKRFDGGADETL